MRDCLVVSKFQLKQYEWGKHRERKRERERERERVRQTDRQTD